MTYQSRAQERILDLLGEDVLSAGHEHAVGPAVYPQPSKRVELTGITGPEPPVTIERPLQSLLAEVPRKTHRTSHQDFPVIRNLYLPVWKDVARCLEVFPRRILRRGCDLRRHLGQPVREVDRDAGIDASSDERGGHSAAADQHSSECAEGCTPVRIQ